LSANTQRTLITDISLINTTSVAFYGLNNDSYLCDELITRLEESYRLWCVVKGDLGTS